MARNRAVGIVIHNDALLVMYRKNTREYYTLPGGGVEPNETKEQAVARELLEETSIVVKVEKLLYILKHQNSEDIHYYYLCTYVSGQPDISIGTNEYADNLVGKDMHIPQWLPLSKIESTILYPQEVTNMLLRNLKDGYSNIALQIDAESYK